MVKIAAFFHPVASDKRIGVCWGGAGSRKIAL